LSFCAIALLSFQAGSANRSNAVTPQLSNIQQCSRSFIVNSAAHCSVTSPYAIFYVIEPEAIVIMGVVHQARHPSTWQRRA